MNTIQKTIDFLQFLVKSTNQHGIHSPFLFDLYNNVIEDDRTFYDFERLESIRTSHLSNKNEIAIVEMGAGSSYGNVATKKIQDIAKQQLSGAYQLRVLYRLIDWVGAQNTVELGASLGLSSLYLASANKSGQVTSFEGNPHFIQCIEYQKQLTKLHNLHLVEGNFDNTYKAFTADKPRIDLAFIDGNHREKATLDYFQWTLPCIHEETVLVFDDIHWSKGMYAAWKQIIDHPQVTASVDMYTMGIVFFRKDFKEERHLKIRPLEWR